MQNFAKRLIFTTNSSKFFDCQSHYLWISSSDSTIQVVTLFKINTNTYLLINYYNELSKLFSITSYLTFGHSTQFLFQTTIITSHQTTDSDDKLYKFLWVKTRAHFISHTFNKQRLSCFNKYNLSRQILLSHGQIKLYFWYVQ